MRSYFLKRLLLAVPLLLGVSFFAFCLVALIPSDPAEVILRINDIVPTEEAVEGMRAELGLDDPFLLRYVRWLWRSLHLDFGNTFTNDNRTVGGEILRALPATCELAAASLALVLLVSFPLGIVCSLFPNGPLDRVLRLFVFIGTAMPNYWLGLLLMWLFSLKLDLLPTSGRDSWQSLILPALTLSMTYISTYIRLIRNKMIENMGEDYVFYARARGLSERAILLRHVFRNSLHACLTALGMSVPQLIAGTYLVESVFAWPGIGRLCISAIFNRDYPVIQAYILIMGFLFVFCNLAVDLLHGYLDPRLRRT